jgi:hypothetical protein
MSLRRFGLPAALSLFVAGVAQGQLMIPDSGSGDRIMLFDDFDGSLINVDWITDIGAVGWFFTTPKEARVVNGEIWVSDQVADAIHRFDMEREFLGSITAHPGGGSLDNIRGFGSDGSTVWLAIWPSTSTARGFGSYDTSGTPLAFHALNASLFDVEPFQGDLLITNSTSDNIERWSTEGAFLGNFATGIDFPQQLEVLPDGSVLTASTIAASGVEGIYHFDDEGGLIRYIDTELLKGQFGEQVPRGAALLGDGNYLISTSRGVYKYDTAGNSFSEVLAGVDAQYIAPLTGGGCDPCDTNCDGIVDAFDIEPFIDVLVNPNPMPCSPCAGDANGDNVIDAFDIEPFIACLLGP